MANSKIKQILVGTTTYDIEDASAAHLATNNTFTGRNTFGSVSCSSLTAGDDNTNITLDGNNIYSGRLRLILDSPSSGEFKYKFPCKKTVDEAPVNIVTENENNTFTGTNTFKGELKVPTTSTFNYGSKAESGVWFSVKEKTNVASTVSTQRSRTVTGTSTDISDGQGYIVTGSFTPEGVNPTNITIEKISANYNRGQASYDAASNTIHWTIWCSAQNAICKATVKYTSNDTITACAIVSHPKNAANTEYLAALPNKSGTLALTSDVVANPAAAGTTTLTTLQVGSTVYTLPSGGETYEVVELTSSQTTLTDDQYATLTASPFNKIKYYDIIYNFDRESSTEISYTENYLNHGNRITITKATKGITKGSLSSLTSISSYVKNNLDYDKSNTTYALSAYQGKVLNDRLTALENASGGGGVTSVTTSGSGNAVTGASISGNTLTLTKGSTFLTSHQSLANCAKLSGSNTFTGANEFRHTIVTNAGSTGVDVGLKVMIAAAETAPWTKYDYENISYSPNGETTIYTLSYPAKTGTLALTSDVVANPAASGTTTLTKLKVGSTVYTLPSGGGQITPIFSIVLPTDVTFPYNGTLTDEQKALLGTVPIKLQIIDVQITASNGLSDYNKHYLCSNDFINAQHGAYGSTYWAQYDDTKKMKVAFNYDTFTNKTYTISLVESSGGSGGTAGVSSIGGKTGAITLGAGLSMSNNQLVPKIKNIYLDSSDYLCIETN